MLVCATAKETFDRVIGNLLFTKAIDSVSTPCYDDKTLHLVVVLPMLPCDHRHKGKERTYAAGFDEQAR
jgi:hypothetical protein